VSNRLTRNDSLEGNTVYEYDGNDRLLKEVTNGVTTTYTYDNNGNTLTKTVGTAKTTYQWNVENRLVGADTDDDGVNDVTNEYDGDGIRIRQTVAGEETRFLVDKNRDYAQVLEEYTPSKIIKASYIYGHDLISQLRDTERSFYHVDGLGSTRALTDINGLLTDAYSYEAFGEIIKQLGNTQNSYLFAGEQRDPNLGLDYLRARYLDVNSGRFYGRDPFKGIIKNPMTLNPFLYAGNNPVNLIDPSGRFFGLQVAFLDAFYFYLPVALQSAAVATAVYLMTPGFALRNLGMSLVGDGENDDMGITLYENGGRIISLAASVHDTLQAFNTFLIISISSVNTIRAGIRGVNQGLEEVRSLENTLNNIEGIAGLIRRAEPRRIAEIVNLTNRYAQLVFEANALLWPIIAQARNLNYF
jgi:RHS repeat-associated protein